MITKGERTELRSLIRQRFRVLRAEVLVRRAELLVELETGLNDKYAGSDKAWADAAFQIGQITLEANRRANDIIRSLQEGWMERQIVSSVTIGRPMQERHQLHREGVARIEARVNAAYLALDQQEADLLTRLVTGALESEEARAFLGEIPTVSALVPAVRLLELEQSLRYDGGAP